VTFRLAVCTPLYGDSEAAGLTMSYTGSLYFLAKQLDVICGDYGWNAGDVQLDPSPYPNCIEHARNNLVKMFLEHPRDYTHLLFWDADVKGGTPRQVAQLLGKLIKLDRHYIGVPYAAKAHRWEEASRAALEYCCDHDKGVEGVSPNELAKIIQGHAVRYIPDPRFLPFPPPDADGLSEMVHPPLGFALLRRDMLQEMTEHYRDALHYTFHDEKHVGLFHTAVTEDRLLMEDIAFAGRWKAMGGRAYLYMGEGAPLEHVGMTTFRGTREALLSERARLCTDDGTSR
jgi:hypothetical protein